MITSARRRPRRQLRITFMTSRNQRDDFSILSMQRNRDCMKEIESEFMMNLTFDFQSSTHLWQPGHIAADFLKIYDQNGNNKGTSPGKVRGKSYREHHVTLNRKQSAKVKAVPQEPVDNGLRVSSSGRISPPVLHTVTFNFKGVAQSLCLNNSATAAYKDLLSKTNSMEIPHTFNGKISKPHKTRIHHSAKQATCSTETNVKLQSIKTSLSPTVALPKHPRFDNDKLPPSRLEPYYAQGEEEIDLLVDDVIRGMKNLKLEDTKPVVKKQSLISVFEIMFAFKDLGL